MYLLLRRLSDRVIVNDLKILYTLRPTPLEGVVRVVNPSDSGHLTSSGPQVLIGPVIPFWSRDTFFYVF